MTSYETGRAGRLSAHQRHTGCLVMASIADKIWLSISSDFGNKKGHHPLTTCTLGSFESPPPPRVFCLCEATMKTETKHQDHEAPEDNQNDNPHGNVYESDASLNMYLGLHYPSSGVNQGIDPILIHKNMPSHGLRFPQRVANLLISLSPTRTNHKALDVGCAVGGSSFELAKYFDQVDAFDFSENFITAARRMQAEDDEVRFYIPMEADLLEEVKAVHEEGMTSTILSKVNFFTGDACDIVNMANDGTLTTYDGVILSNLLCRLTDPMACLNGLSTVVNPGGVVVLVTPFSWLTEFTPKDKWIGGFYDPISKVPIRSKDVLKEIMETQLGFEKIHEEEIPLIIREHQRKYQYIISEATGWRKRKLEGQEE